MVDIATLCAWTNSTNTTESAPLDSVSMASFSILSPLSAFLSLLLIIGHIVSKDLRAKTGGFVLGSVVNNFILSMHWTLSSYIENLNSPGSCLCLANGSIGFFTGFCNYLYSLAVVYYYKKTIQGMIQRSNAPIRNYIVHILCVVISFLLTLLMIFNKGIGPDFLGMCSKRHVPHMEYFTGAIIPVLYGLYIIFAVYMYWYIKKTFGVAIATNPDANKFLKNFATYLIFATILWPAIVTVNSYAEYTSYRGQITRVLTPLKNVCVVTQVILFTIYWYREPTIQKTVKKFISMCCCLKEKKKSIVIVPETEPFLHYGSDSSRYEISRERLSVP